MQIDTAKLRDIIPDLEFWTGGERRDLDAKIAEACGTPAPVALLGRPHYLGTDPAIATEDMQRLVRECGREWGRLLTSDGIPMYAVFVPMSDDFGTPSPSLPLAFARAVIAKEDGK